MKNINPEIEGVYLCKVRGKKYCNHEVLRYSKNDGWWQYYKDYSRKDSDIEGWVGLDSKVTVESFQLIEKDAKQSKKSFIYGYHTFACFLLLLFDISHTQYNVF